MAYQVYYNGIYLDETKALISVADRGFLVGEGLFETMRAYQGHIAFLEEHLKRMREASIILGLEFPVSPTRLKFLIYETLHVNRLSEAVVRLYLTPEGSSIGDLDSPPEKFNLLISCRPFEPFPSAYYETGVSCLFVKGIVAEMGLIAQIKSTSYLSRVLARRQARSHGAFEGILLNIAGQVAEGSGSNVFVVEGEKVFTPPLGLGLLAGVTRSQVFKVAEREKIPVEERALTPDDLTRAQEIFLTSTLKEVMPVAEVQGQNLALTAPGPITQRLMGAYRDWVQFQVEQYLSQAAGITELS